MDNHLIQLEQKALNLKNKHEFGAAIKLYKKIVEENPNYEFGICFYDMAQCLVQIGKLEEANENYLKSIEYDDEDDIRLAGYASFLYLHGEPNEALKAYLKLLALKNKNHLDITNTLIAIKTLAKKIGLKQSELEALISDVTSIKS